MFPTPSALPRTRTPVFPEYLYRSAIVFVGYFVAGKLGLSMPFTSGNVSPVWPPSGIALAAVLVWGYRVWPGIALGAFLVNFLSPIPHAAALGIAAGNTSSALVGAYLLRRTGFRPSLSRLQDVLALVVLGAGVSPIVAATTGVATLFITGVNPWLKFGSAWLIWWLGDAMGVLILTPLILTWRALSGGTARRQAELAALLIAAVVSCILVFDPRIGLGVADEVLAFAVFPFVIWGATRFGTEGAAMVSTLLAAVAVGETAAGLGPFSPRPAVHNAVLLQMFLAVISVTGLVLAAVIMERERAEHALAREQELLRERDISEHALRQSEQRLKLAQLAASIGTWEWNIRTGQVSWSDEVAALHGMSLQEFDGRYESWLSTVHAEDRGGVVAEVMRAVKETGQYEVEYRSLRRDGKTCWTYARGQVLYDQAGSPERLMGLCMDISRRKLQEQALIESENKFRAVAETAASAIYIHDGTRVVYANKAAEEITGYSREELLALDMWTLVHPNFINTVRERAVARLRGDPVPSRYEYKILTKAGEERWIDFSASTVNFEGKGCILATALDITDRKRAEETLIRTEKLATAGRMAATIAHEINNPLEAVTNLLYLAKSSPAADQHLRNYLELADAELKRVSHIAKQTLGFYRETSTPARFRPAAVLAEVLELLETKILERRVRIVRQDRGEPEIMGVAGELRQVFSNLLTNSLDSMPAGGQITVRVSNGRGWGDGARTGVRITIADNGTGIAAAHLRDIFEPFFTTKKDAGTGLGLWVAKQIVHKHGGTIRVRSRVAEKGGWTVFSLFLPENAAEKAEPAVA
ncbi:MAG TPA: MASE1 domain-containing protein [Terriglobales bacterium]|nr:MASE1 domain-containing protein [Terriglobales bacterium]